MPSISSRETMEAACRKAGIIPSQHCCLKLSYSISKPVLTKHQGPNRIIEWISIHNEYWIPLSYDGYSATQIRFCPWCGKELPSSNRDLWYKTLYALGYDDPGNQNIPPAYNSDAWWRKL